MIRYLENIDLIKGPAATGLHIEIEGDRETCFMVRLEKKAGAITASDKRTTELEEVFSRFPKDVPVYLSVDGKGLIHKKVQGGLNNYSARTAFPNIQLQDFFVQYKPVDDNHLFISLIRKQHLREYLQPFLDKNIPVAGLVLGPFSFPNLIPLLDTTTQSSFALIHQHVVIAEGQLANIHKNKPVKPAQYDVAGEVLENTFLLPFANALGHYYGTQAGRTEWEEPPALNKDEWLYAKTNKLFGKAVLIFFLTVLLVNFGLYASMSAKVEELEAQQLQYEQILNEKEKVQQELELKKELLLRSGFSHTFHFTKYADLIASSVPRSITLVSLSINPLADRLKKQRELDFANGVIQIEGTASSSSSLSDWNDRMKEWDWVSTVNIIHFYKEDDKNIFTIEIHLNET